MAGGLALLDAAVIAMAQAHLWTIFLQVEELLAVECSSTLPGKQKKTNETKFFVLKCLITSSFALNGGSYPLPGIAGLTYCRMNWTASSYFIPHSINARATRTGALQGNTRH